MVQVLPMSSIPIDSWNLFSSSLQFRNLLVEGTSGDFPFRLSLCIVWLCDSASLTSAAGKKKHLMMTGQSISLWVQQNMIRSHFTDVFSIYRVWLYLMSLGYPVSGSLSSRQCRLWFPSRDMGLKLNPNLVGHSHKFWVSIAPTLLADRTDCRLRVLWQSWYPGFTFCKLQSTFHTREMIT